MFRIDTISSESTTNNTDSELIHKICNVVYRMLTAKLYGVYLTDIERNANTRHTTKESSYKIDSFKEYKIGKSKSIIDKIDDLICPLYGLTQKETDFIKNYEIEFRLSEDD